MTTQRYTVLGMTCAHCEASVREELAELAGVSEVRADHATGDVLVTSSAPLDPADVAAAVEVAGYRVG